MSVAIVATGDSTLLVRIMGELTYEDVQRLLDEMAKHLETVGHVSVLSDSRGITRVPTTHEIRRIAGQLKPLMDRGVRGFAIVTDGGFIHGVARMFAVFAQMARAKVAVFRNMDEAGVWLAAQHKAAEAV